jgi:hypothetical protein
MECSDKNKKKWKAYNERRILKISGRRGLPAAPEIPCWEPAEDNAGILCAHLLLFSCLTLMSRMQGITFGDPF